MSLFLRFWFECLILGLESHLDFPETSPREENQQQTQSKNGFASGTLVCYTVVTQCSSQEERCVTTQKRLCRRLLGRKLRHMLSQLCHPFSPPPASPLRTSNPLWWATFFLFSFTGALPTCTVGRNYCGSSRPNDTRAIGLTRTGYLAWTRDKTC